MRRLRALATANTMPTQFTISELANEFSLTTRAMRFYEDMGLLQPERVGTAGRQRIYSLKDRARLKLTLRAKMLGLTLVEAKEIIDLYESPRDTGVQLERFLEVLSLHKQRIQSQIQDLQNNLHELEQHEAEARLLLKKMPC